MAIYTGNIKLALSTVIYNLSSEFDGFYMKTMKKIRAIEGIFTFYSHDIITMYIRVKE